MCINTFAFRLLLDIDHIICICIIDDATVVCFKYTQTYIYRYNKLLVTYFGLIRLNFICVIFKFLSQYGGTALICASYNGHLDVVCELKNLGAAIDTQTFVGCFIIGVNAANIQYNIQCIYVLSILII